MDWLLGIFITLIGIGVAVLVYAYSAAGRVDDD